MENPWQPIETAPHDGTQVLLASIDDAPDTEMPLLWGVRQGFFEKGSADQAWYDIDGEEVFPQFWMPLPPAPIVP